MADARYVSFTQLDEQGKKTARAAWKSANPSRPSNPGEAPRPTPTDAEIDAKLANEQYTKDGQPAPDA